MNDQQKRFVDEYFIDFNGTKAAIRAGYSEVSARSQASQIFAIQTVKDYYEEKKRELDLDLEISTTFVKKRFKEISDRCMQAEPVMIFNGEEWVKSGEYKFDSSGANKATEALGKIVGAFEKDNQQTKPQQTTIINLGEGVNPDEATS